MFNKRINLLIKFMSFRHNEAYLEKRRVNDLMITRKQSNLFIIQELLRVAMDRKLHEEEKLGRLLLDNAKRSDRLDEGSIKN